MLIITNTKTWVTWTLLLWLLDKLNSKRKLVNYLVEKLWLTLLLVKEKLKLLLSKVFS